MAKGNRWKKGHVSITVRHHRLHCIGYVLAAAMILGGSRRLWGQKPTAAPEVQAHESAPPFQIRAEANLVMVGVVVRDSNGRPIGDLHKEDFRVFDNGKPREITGFTVETAGGAAGPTAAASPGAPSVNPAPHNGAATQAAIVPQRFVALYFDNLHMDAGQIDQTRKAAWHYISSGLRPEDRVAIATSYGAGGLDFTADRDRLHEALFQIAPGPPVTTQHECPAISDYQSYLMQERQDNRAIGIATAEVVRCTCRSMRSCPDLRPVVRALASDIWSRVDKRAQDALDVAGATIGRLALTPGQRSLVLVSPGFLTITRPREVAALIDRALREDVVIHAIDPAGLYVEPTFTDTYPGGPGSGLADAKIALEKNGLIAKTGVLADLAGGTGGTFFRNSNDLDAGFLRVAPAPEVRYVLSFSPGDLKRDGSFHTLKVALKRGDHWDIQARRGYYAAPEERIATQTEVESLVFSQEELRGFPAAMAAVLEKPVEQLSTLNVKVRVEIRDMPFRKEGDRKLNTLTFDTVLFDQDGKYVTGKESVLDFRLTDARLEALRQSGVTAQISLRVVPGAYRIREIVWDAESKKMATLNYSVGLSAASASTPLTPKTSQAAQHKDLRRPSP